MTSPAPAEPLSMTIAAIDAAVARVTSKKDAWPRVTLEQRIQLLRRCLEGVVAVAGEWVKEGCALKGIDPSDTLAGEEWLAGPWQTARNIRLLIEALEAGGAPKPSKVRTRSSGHAVARVFPRTLFDRALFGGFTGEVWMEQDRAPTQGAIYREASSAEAKVTLVLGGGNVSSIPPMDALYKLFVENELVVLKMNPVNARIGPRLEEALRPLIELDFMAIAYGGADVGAHLANHPQIEKLHVTGSDKTYDAIVWGSDATKSERANTRPFTAELGCVTPILVVPGPWSESDLDFQARHVAAMVAQNASFNCNAAKVLVTASGWVEQKTFLAKVHEALARTAPRKAYYPGAEDRYRRFVERYPQAIVLGERGEAIVPWTAIPNVPANDGEYALNEEAFCGVLAEVSIDTDDAAEFLAKATTLANEKCWGTLSIGILIHPATAERFDVALDRAIADLRYGAIAINAWPGIAYALVSTTWGAYPGHTPADIRSGAGIVHNAFMFDRPLKSVVRAPFRIRPKPPWFADHRNLAEVGKRLLAFEAAPSWSTVVSVAAAALKG